MTRLKSFLLLYRKELVDELKNFHLCQDLKLIIGIGVWELWNFRFPILALNGLTGSLTKLFDFLKLVWIVLLHNIEIKHTSYFSFQYWLDLASVKVTKIVLLIIAKEMSLVMRKPVFGVSDQV